MATQLNDWLKRAKEKNPGASKRQLVEFHRQKYGYGPDEADYSDWAGRAAEKNPGAAPEQLRQFYESTYGPVDDGSGAVSDLGVRLKQGFQRLPSVLTSIADLPFAALAGDAKLLGVPLGSPVSAAADALGDLTGFNPDQWAEENNQNLSETGRRVQHQLNQAWDDGTWGDVAAGYAGNPLRAVGGLIAESAPQMLAGGPLGRVLGVAGKVAAARLGASVAGQAIRNAAPVIGEGAIIAGNAQNNLVEQGVDPRVAALASVGAGVTGGAIGLGGLAASRSLGLADIDTLLTGISTRAVPPPRLGYRLGMGSAVEAGEEMLQGPAEQLFTNMATGDPLTQGMARAAVEGGLAGGAMGALFNVRAPGAPAAPAPSTTTTTNNDPLDYTGRVDLGVPPAESGAVPSAPKAPAWEVIAPGGGLLEEPAANVDPDLWAQSVLYGSPLALEPAVETLSPDAMAAGEAEILRAPTPEERIMGQLSEEGQASATMANGGFNHHVRNFYNNTLKDFKTVAELEKRLEKARVSQAKYSVAVGELIQNRINELRPQEEAAAIAAAAKAELTMGADPDSDVDSRALAQSVLSDAVQMAGNLTAEEKAALSLTYGIDFGVEGVTPEMVHEAWDAQDAKGRDEGQALRNVGEALVTAGLRKTKGAQSIKNLRNKALEKVLTAASADADMRSKIQTALGVSAPSETADVDVTYVDDAGVADLRDANLNVVDGAAGGVGGYAGLSRADKKAVEEATAAAETAGAEVSDGVRAALEDSEPTTANETSTNEFGVTPEQAAEIEAQNRQRDEQAAAKAQQLWDATNTALNAGVPWASVSERDQARWVEVNKLAAEAHTADPSSAPEIARTLLTEARAIVRNATELGGETAVAEPAPQPKPATTVVQHKKRRAQAAAAMPEPKGSAAEIIRGAADALLAQISEGVVRSYKGTGRAQATAPTQALVDKWRDALGIKEAIPVSQSKDATSRFNRTSAGGGKPIALGIEIDEGALRALANPERDPVAYARAVEVVLHEMGHALDHVVFNQLPQQLRSKLDDAHKAWELSQAELTADQIDIGRSTPLYAASVKGGGKRDVTNPRKYALKRNEWVADNVARALLNRELEGVQTDEVRGIFAQMAEQARALYRRLMTLLGAKDPDAAVEELVARQLELTALTRESENDAPAGEYEAEAAAQNRAANAARNAGIDPSEPVVFEKLTDESRGFAGTPTGSVFGTTRDKAQEIFDKLPPQVRDTAKGLWSTAKDMGGAAIGGLSFLHDRADYAKAKVPVLAEPIDQFMGAITRKKVDETKLNKRVSDILRIAQSAPRKGFGGKRESDLLNEFLRQSRMIQAWGYTPDWDKSVTPDPAMAELYNQLSSQSQEAARKIHELMHENIQTKQRLLDDRITRVYDDQIAGLTDPDAIAALKKERDQKLKTFRQLLPKVEGPYSPFKRDGNIVVQYASPELRQAQADGDTARVVELRVDPDHHVLEFVGNRIQAEKRVRELSAIHGEGTVGQWKKADWKNNQFVDTSMVEQLRAIIMGKAEDAPAEDKKSAAALLKMADELALEMLSQRHARQAHQQANYIPGADPDMLKSFVQQGRADANYIANLRHMGEAARAMSEMARRAEKPEWVPVEDRDQVYTYVNDLHWHWGKELEFVETPIQNFFMGLNSIWDLVLSPAYYAQNATQVHLMSMPYMAGDHGWKKTLDALNKAYTAGAGKMIANNALSWEHFNTEDVAGEYGPAIKDLEELGIIDITMPLELGSFAETGDSPLSRAGQAFDNTFRRLPGKLETINRVVTGIAAYQLELDKTGDHKKAVDYAKDVILTTHGDYSAAATPKWISPNFIPGAKVLSQYRKFQLIQIAYMSKLINRSMKEATTDEQRQERAAARWALAFTIGHAGLVTGAAGLPGVAAAASALALVGGLGGDDDEPFNKDTMARDVREAFASMGLPPEMANLITTGMPSLIGSDITSMVGMQNMASLFPYDSLDPREYGSYERFVVATLGPTAANAGEFVRAAGQWQRGDIWGAIREAMPSGVTNVMKGIEFGTTGKRQLNGDVALTPEELSWWDTVQRGLGFTPLIESQQFAAQAQERTFETHFQQRAQDLKAEFIEAFDNGDALKMTELRSEWGKLQQARQDRGFAVQPLTQLVRAPAERARRELRTRMGVQYGPSTRGFTDRSGELYGR